MQFSQRAREIDRWCRDTDTSEAACPDRGDRWDPGCSQLLLAAVTGGGLGPRAGALWQGLRGQGLRGQGLRGQGLCGRGSVGRGSVVKGSEAGAPRQGLRGQGLWQVLCWKGRVSFLGRSAPAAGELMGRGHPVAVSLCSHHTQGSGCLSSDVVSPGRWRNESYSVAF